MDPEAPLHCSPGSQRSQALNMESTGPLLKVCGYLTNLSEVWLSPFGASWPKGAFPLRPRLRITKCLQFFGRGFPSEIPPFHDA